MGSVGTNANTLANATTAQLRNLQQLNASNPAALQQINQELGNRAETARTNAINALKGISGSKRFNEINIEQPSTGDNLRVSVEKVTTRDYWGRSTGRQTYTLNIYNTSKQNEYGNNERLYYNYGIESMKDVKDYIRRIAGI